MSSAISSRSHSQECGGSALTSQADWVQQGRSGLPLGTHLFSKMTASENDWPWARGMACRVAQQAASLRAPPSFLWL